MLRYIPSFRVFWLLSYRLLRCLITVLSYTVSSFCRSIVLLLQRGHVNMIQIRRFIRK